MEKVKSIWQWPETGQPAREVLARIDQLATLNIDYKHKRPLGFPGTAPPKLAIKAFVRLMRIHANNIGCHTNKDSSKPAESGFAGSQAMEQEYIYCLANLLGAKDPRGIIREKDKINGFMCGGGTEGNFNGLWIGRNKLLDLDKTGNSKIAVLTSFLTHYSIRKNCDQLMLGEGKWEKCYGKHRNKKEANHIFVPNPDGSGLHIMPTNPLGQLCVKDLDEKILDLFAKKDVNKFILVLNACSINMGSIDPIPEICALVKRLEREKGLAGRIFFHIHVDAAFGGYVIPFLESEYKFGFHNPRVDSISVDAHKMGYVPYPAGVFLCRRDQQEKFISRPAGYLAGHIDDTSSGSRPGAAAAAALALVNGLGREGYTAILRKAMKVLFYLRKRLSQIPGVRLFPIGHRVNILTVRFPEAIEQLLETENKSKIKLADRLYLPSDQFPDDFRDVNSCPFRVYRFIAMPHSTIADIDKFIKRITV